MRGGSNAAEVDDDSESDEEDEDWSQDLQARVETRHPKMGRGQSSFLRQQLIMLGYTDKLQVRETDSLVMDSGLLARAETFSPGRVLLDHPEAAEKVLSLADTEDEKKLVQANIDEAIASFLATKDEGASIDNDSEEVFVGRPDDEARYSKPLGHSEEHWQQAASMQSTKKFGMF